jgi:hypothetical protein
MARTRRTARKSTGRQPTGQLGPWDMPHPQEPLHDSPQEEEPFEIMVMAPERQEPQGAPVEEPQLLELNCHSFLISGCLSKRVARYATRP